MSQCFWASVLQSAWPVDSRNDVNPLIQELCSNINCPQSDPIPAPEGADKYQQTHKTVVRRNTDVT